MYQLGLIDTYQLDTYQMPEGPECTLMAHAIRQIISGKKLHNITILGGRYLLKGLDNLDQLAELYPITIESVNIKGKFCWIELADDWYISITFGMSGGIYYEPSDEQDSKQAYMKNFHIKFETDDGQCFYFGDPRRFGTITISNDHAKLDKKLTQLGPDMLNDQPITDRQFIKIFRQPKFNQKNICRVLMEQKAISGVGNYIKAEVLYDCHINPWALVSDLDDPTLTQLHHSIRQISQQAYEARGASLYTYRGTSREQGAFQEMLKVYNQSADPDGRPVIIIPDKISPDRRTTHYVPLVQTIGNHRDPRPIKKIKITIREPTD